MLINLATANIDFNNTDKALRQIHNNVMQLKDTIEMAMNNLDAGNITLDSGQSLQVAVNSETLRGPQGVPGQDGYSPRVNITKENKITTINIQDSTGNHVAQINDGIDGINGVNGVDGQNGADGRDGTDGQDGFSPTIVVKTDTDTEYVLTITDKNGSFDTPNLRG